MSYTLNKDNESQRYARCQSPRLTSGLYGGHDDCKSGGRMVRKAATPSVCFPVLFDFGIQMAGAY